MLAKPEVTLAQAIASLDWQSIESEINKFGYATTGPLLSPELCAAITASYATPSLFRSRVVMARQGFGLGEYQYFAYPLPDTIQILRATLYPHLARIANTWATPRAIEETFPAQHSDFQILCHQQGQLRPTPLLLRYGPGDYNCLHQDLYRDLHFPLQAAFLLDRPGQDFTGGEFVLTEQRPRMQSRAEVVPLQQGEAVIFAVNQRPVQGTRGTYRVNMRHGVSRLRSGKRHTLGIIFHDAR